MALSEGRKGRLLAAGMMAVALCLARASGQTARSEADRLAGPSPGTVTGKVMNSRGEPLPGARITLRRGEASWSAETDAEGAYCFCRITSSSDYTLRVEKEGFASVLVMDVVVGKGRVAVHNLILRPGGEILPPAGKGETGG